MSLNFHLLLLLGQLVSLALRTTAEDQMFKLRMSHESVVKGWTEDVTIHCGMEGSTTVDKVFQIRISKVEEDGTATPIAALTSSGKQVSIQDDSMKVTSKNKATSNESYLEISWPLAGNTTVGRFRCDATGIKEGLKHFHVTPETKAIRAVEVSDEILMEGIKRLRGDGKRFMDLLTAIKNKVDRNGLERNIKMFHVFDRVDTILKTCQHNTGVLVDINQDLERIKTNTQSILEGIQSLIKTAANQPWPGGSFALLIPQNGCPVSSAEARNHIGVHKYHAESSSTNIPRTTFSPNIHLSLPFSQREGGNNFLYFRYCAINKSEIGAPAWPKGSYCIKRFYPKKCPTGFVTSETFIWIRNEKRNTQTSVNYNTGTAFLQPEVKAKDYSHLAFCCTQTGKYSEAIALPRSRPFYLYRNHNNNSSISGYFY